ncbi:hypothetical protein, partial [Escherichia coli]|uniref:hypothetical protein n=1 Tax=Escherichia coli TaxID=562 RepID=UPI001FF47352
VGSITPAAVDILATVVTSIRKRFHLHSFNPIAKADLLNRIKRGSLIQFISLFVRILILFLYFFEEMSTEHDIICSPDYRLCRVLYDINLAVSGHVDISVPLL